MFDSKSSRQLPVLAVVCLAFFLFAATASAQTVTGTLQGTVSDAKGAVVPGAQVLIHNMETGQERTLQTNGDGAYIASFLPLGRYTVTVTSTGFSKVSQENIEITLNQTRVINFTLNPSSVTGLMVRADMFNALNHVRYGFPSSVITNTNFGAITSLATLYVPRNVQVSLRYQY